MKRTFNATVWQEDDWFVAQCLDIDLASQGASEEEALANLREALELHFSPPSQRRCRVYARSRSRSVPPKPLAKRKLEAAGFAEVSQAGSHVKFPKQIQGGTRTAIVPRHREVASGTLRSTIRQAGLRIEKFEAL